MEGHRRLSAPGLTLDESTGVISGTPTAQSTSNFTVTAANNGGSDSEQLSITINQAANVPVESVSLSQTELRLIEGDTGALTATVEPDNATNQNVTWSSDNESVATVDNGVVTAVAAGTATAMRMADAGYVTRPSPGSIQPSSTKPAMIHHLRRRATTTISLCGSFCC